MKINTELRCNIEAMIIEIGWCIDQRLYSQAWDLLSEDARFILPDLNSKTEKKLEILSRDTIIARWKREAEFTKRHAFTNIRVISETEEQVKATYISLGFRRSPGFIRNDTSITAISDIEDFYAKNSQGDWSLCERKAEVILISI